MAEFKVLKTFRLLDNGNVPNVGPIQEAGEIIDITVKRAAEVEKNLDSSFLERCNSNNNNDGEAVTDEVVAEVAETGEQVEGDV